MKSMFGAFMVIMLMAFTTGFGNTTPDLAQNSTEDHAFVKADLKVVLEVEAKTSIDVNASCLNVFELDQDYKFNLQRSNININLFKKLFAERTETKYQRKYYDDPDIENHYKPNLSIYFILPKYNFDANSNKINIPDIYKC